MNKLDFAAINQALDADKVVQDWLQDGFKRGAEWVARNPNRNDKTPGSFTINLRTGVWKDFAGGAEDAGSDLVSLYAYLFHHGDQGAAAKELAKDHGVRVGDPEVRKQAAERDKVASIEDAKPVPVFPVPVDVSPPSFKHHEFGEPTATWTYRDKEGRVLLHVCRFDPPGMRKQVIPRSWCRHPDGTTRWTWRGITGTTKRPLYGLERLAAEPEADAILVEGEKTADAAQRLFGNAAICTAWLGGGAAAEHVNVNALAGRRVTLWPDFDSQREALTQAEKDAGVDPASKPFKPLHEQPGIVAMMKLAQRLKGVAREVIMVGYQVAEFADGWDLADAETEGWTTEQAASYMVNRCGDPVAIVAPRRAPQAPTPAPGAAAREEDAPQAPGKTAANEPQANVPLNATVNPYGFPHQGDKGTILNTVENLQYMLGEYGITVQYNIIRKFVEVAIPGRDYGDDLKANAVLAEIGSICARNRMPKADAADYIKLISTRAQYNPVEDFIRSKPWDGVSRFAALCDTLTTAPGYDRSIMQLLVRRWLISAAAAALKPRGFWSKGVLVLQGGQSEGKTSWIKSLLPDSLRSLMKVGATIDPANKDSVSGVISHWLVELGELDGTFRKADIARLKSFISQDVDELRRPYDRLESEYQRRTVFFASVNPKAFLVDDTGNVRWWTIPIVAVNVDHGIDVQQLWAEAASYYEAGERWWLDREEERLLEKTNEDHQEPNTVEELIRARFDWTSDSRTALLSATEVLLHIGFDRPTNPQAKTAGVVLRKLTGEEPHKSHGRVVFKLPPPMGDLARMRRLSAANDEDRPF